MEVNPDYTQLRNLKIELRQALAELRCKEDYVRELRRKILLLDKVDREAEVRQRLLAGQTYRRIADEMTMSQATIAKISRGLFGYRNPFWARCTACPGRHNCMI